jgi:16S rRNA (guanine(527)-N(7))-methyltransferase RsmG
VGSELPDISRQDFGRRLEARGPDVSRETVPAALADTLYRHYLELRRWNPRLSLVGPGTAEDVVERHYGESLAALPALSGLRAGATLVDVGSGAGFPGLVLAAARPDLEVFLVEPRQRKWSFLMAATQRCGLSCRCVNARVGATLPEDLPLRIDALTCRGLRLPADALAPLIGRMPLGGRWLAWSGIAPPEMPGMRRSTTIPLLGRERRLVVLERQDGGR